MIKILIRGFALIALFLTANIALSQAQYMQDINGVAMPTKIYTNVDGSPYLIDNWVKGSVKLANGKTYKDVLLKYDMVDGQLYFQHKPEETLTFVDPVKEFKLSYIESDMQQLKLFRNGYPSIAGGNEKSFYEVLSDGTIQLLKHDAKSISEYKEYNSATVTKKFDDNIKYYLYNNNKLVAIKPDKKSILAAIPNKQPELDAYIKTNNLNLKKDEDLAKLIIYYNSL
jgi:hypothetical protein